LIPAVYRNARYEYRFALLESRVIELALQLQGVCGMVERLAFAMTPENHIPALPQTERGFGKGH